MHPLLKEIKQKVSMYRVTYEVGERKGVRTYKSKSEYDVRKRFVKDYGKEEDGSYIISITKY